MIRTLLLVSLLLFLGGAHPAAAAGEGWITFTSRAYGYTVRYPAVLGALDRAEYEKRDRSTVPSDVWFGPNYHIITRIPPLPDEAAERLPAEMRGAPLGTTGRTLPILQRLVRAPGADYILIYEASDVNPGPEAAKRAQFEELAASFRLLDGRTYQAPSSAPTAGLADAFDDLATKPNAGARPPDFAAFNTRNFSLYSKLSLCYGKPVSQIQHTGEDWFRPGYSPIYAIANGRVVYAQDTSYPGAVVVVEHTLPFVPSPLAPLTPFTSGERGGGWDGSRVYSVYAHLETWGYASPWSEVRKGQMIGRVLWQGANSHVHFELRRTADLSRVLTCPVSGGAFFVGPGYTDSGVNPDQYGYLNPTEWIAAHRQAPRSNLAMILTSPLLPQEERGAPSLSADGQLVAFESRVSGLGEGRERRAVFTADRAAGQISRAPDAPGQDGWDAFRPALSGDGRWLAYLTAPPDGTGSSATLMLADRTSGQVTVVTDRAVGGALSLSGDGALLAFAAKPESNPGRSDIFVYDRLSGQSTRLSLAADGADGDGVSTSPSISADGQFVAFVSGSANLARGDNNRQPDVFVHDRLSGRTQRVSLGWDGTEWQGASRRPSISADGRYVAFESNADTFATGQKRWNVYIHDRLTGLTRRISLSPAGREADGDSTGASISADGRRVVFTSTASNLVENDPNRQSAIFLHDRESGLTAHLSPARGGGAVLPALASGGNAAAFWSLAPGAGGAAELLVWTPAGENR